MRAWPTSPATKISRGTCSEVDLASAHTLPASLYVDAGVPALERDALFARAWQLVGQVSQLEGAGDHVIADVAGVPLVVVRGIDGTIRALHNVCRHRAGPLATCAGRGARALRCRYHGWTYTLDGQLKSAPEMGTAANFEVSSIRLPQAQAEVWRGLVFAAVGAAPPLADVLAGIDARLRDHPLAGYVHAGGESYEIACNWKVYVDNYLEGYHVPHIHPALNRMLDYRSYTTETAAWFSLQSSPLAGRAADGGEAAAPGAARRPDAERTAESGPYTAGEALYYFVFPNTMLNVLPDRLQTNRVTPLAADRCRVDFDYYYPKHAPGGLYDDDRRFSDEVQREDVAICEAVQRGLASGSYTSGRLNPLRESAVFHFHELIRAALRQHAAGYARPGA
jgi:choline monooxygenase